MPTTLYINRVYVMILFIESTDTVSTTIVDEEALNVLKDALGEYFEEHAARAMLEDWNNDAEKAFKSLIVFVPRKDQNSLPVHVT